MLLSFRFENHRSFRDEAQLNLMPAYASEDRAVRVLGVFGANASGKSNLISALSFMSGLVGRSDREVEPGLGLRRLSFRLDPRIEAKPSSYVVDLLLNNVRHTYGFTISDERVLDEWLYSYPLGPRRKLFERHEDQYSWGERSKGSPLEGLADITASTALFLSVTARFGRFENRPPDDEFADGIFNPFHQVYRWLWQRVARAYPSAERIGDRRISRIEDLLLSDSRRFRVIVDLLRSADLGLLDMSLVISEDEESLSGGEIVEPGQSSTISSASRRLLERPRLQFHHRGAVGDVLFSVGDESDGTMRLLDLATQALSTLDSGGLLLVDEIDASLHPLLTARLIELFQSKRVNRNNAQLLFTSHDAVLLGSLDGVEVLDRDQIWFVEKGEAGASILYSLVEFKPRKQDENRQRRYLSGKYGAVPDVSLAIFEHALQSRSNDIEH